MISELDQHLEQQKLVEPAFLKSLRSEELACNFQQDEHDGTSPGSNKGPTRGISADPWGIQRIWQHHLTRRVTGGHLMSASRCPNRSIPITRQGRIDLKLKFHHIEGKSMVIQ